MKKNSKLQFNYIKRDKSGITLIETIVALGILITGIFAASTLMLSSLNYSKASEQTIVVVNLAREGIEMVRSIRSLNGFANIPTGNRIVNIDYVTGDLEFLLVDNDTINLCDNCILDLHNGRYLHNTPSAETNFRRKISIIDENSYEKKIISQVYWIESGHEHFFTLETHITDW